MKVLRRDGESKNCNTSASGVCLAEALAAKRKKYSNAQQEFRRNTSAPLGTPHLQRYAACSENLADAQSATTTQNALRVSLAAAQAAS